MVQVYSDETATTPKANAIGAYPIDFVLLKFTIEVCQHVIDHGYALAGLLTVSNLDICKDEEESNMRSSVDLVPVVSVVPLCDETPASTTRNGRHLELQALHDAIRRILNPPESKVWSGFRTSSCDIKCSCHPVIALYCCDISENKDM